MSNLMKLENIADLRAMGELMARSGMFADTREAAQACVKIQAGQELGFPTFASLTGIHVIKGKCCISANLIAAAVKRSGKYNYRVSEMSETSVSIVFFEQGKPCGTSTFTLEMAKAAGLTGNDTWRKFPTNMLFARAMSNGAKWFCADVFGGPIYTPDEMGAEVNEEGDVVAVAESPALPAPAVQKALPEAPKSTRDLFLEQMRAKFGDDGVKVGHAALIAAGWTKDQGAPTDEHYAAALAGVGTEGGAK